MSAADESARFAVIQSTRGPRDPLVIGKAIAAARKTPVQDQMLAARSGWGIIGDKLTESEAHALVEVLRAAGVECLACPASTLIEIPKAEPAVNRGALPESRPTLIAGAGVTVSTETKTTETRGPTAGQKLLSTAITLGTGLPVKIGGRKRKVETTREEHSIVFYVDLYYEEPFRHLRIAASKFDYSCLGARKLFQAQANLKVLVGDLIAAAPDAWVNHGTGVLMEGKPMQTMGYGSLGDLEKESRWLLTLRSMGGDGPRS